MYNPLDQPVVSSSPYDSYATSTLTPEPTSAELRARSSLEVATFTVFLVLTLLILPVLSMLNAKFMAFHKADSSTIERCLNSIPILGWLIIAGVGSILLWIKSRTTAASSFPINLFTLLFVTISGIVLTAILAAPMYSILTALGV